MYYILSNNKGVVMDKILNEIKLERARQDQKWGIQAHPPSKWLVILAEEFGEVARSILEKDFDQYRAELIHVAAVAVAMVECADKK
jgi:hypothetical protein